MNKILIAGVIVLALTILFNVSVLVAMGCGFIPFRDPPKLLWAGLGLSTWLVIIGGAIELCKS